MAVPDKALMAYIKNIQKSIKEDEELRKELIAMNNKKPVSTFKEQLKHINDRIAIAEKNFAMAKKIEKEGY